MNENEQIQKENIHQIDRIEAKLDMLLDAIMSEEDEDMELEEEN